MNDKIIDLAKKLKALADRGIDGEKENAITMLEAYMKKHNISHEDIDGEKIIRHDFYIEPERLKFFKQVIASVLGLKYSWGIYTYKLKKAPGKDRCYVECSDAAFIEINAKFDFYYHIYEKELALFYSAFIQKSKLFAKPTGDQTETKELTKEELERIMRMASIMDGISVPTFHLQLKQ